MMIKTIEPIDPTGHPGHLDHVRADIPIALTGERAWRTYLGGRLIDDLHGIKDGEDGHFPEEWIASLVWARNTGREHIREGLSRLCEHPEISLAEVIEANPGAFLGESHAARYGSSMGVLVKLIDGAERLTVQVHPDREAAGDLFSSDYGKTECWHILGGRQVDGQGPSVYLGFKEGITQERWKGLFDRQDISGMLDCLHRFPVSEGDTILIEGGIPHAIGAGCFLAEIQEPTDFTVRVERTTPSGFAVDDFMCHQGLGFERMFDCFHFGGLSREETRARWFLAPRSQGGITRLVGPPDTDFFAMNLLELNQSLLLELPPRFSGLYILKGSGQLAGGIGRKQVVQPISRGQQFFVPPGTGRLELQATPGETLRILHFFGPE